MEMRVGPSQGGLNAFVQLVDRAVLNLDASPNDGINIQQSDFELVETFRRWNSRNSINGRRISQRFGREKQIGHSYFIDGVEPIGDAETFAKRFRREVLPLLQEYCFDDYAGLASLIGTKLVNEEMQEINVETLNDPDLLIAALVELSGPIVDDEVE